jgi:CRISPR-associated protein Cas1
MTRLFVRITRDNLPKVKDRYPFLYLEKGRLNIDDSSLKWVSGAGDVIRLPVATISCIMLGPGTSVTHEAVKVAAASNCMLLWVSEDSLVFHAAGQSPTATTSNIRHQAKLSSLPSKSIVIARKMFSKRFPDVDVSAKNLKELMGMEGSRVKKLYEEKANEYGVGWQGRRHTPGNFKMGTTTNKLLTAYNQSLYGIVSSCIHALGYSPHLGFVHSGSPLPFVYDIADLYKGDVSIDLAFKVTKEMAGMYDREIAVTRFREKILEMGLLNKIPSDILELLGGKDAGRYC